MIKKVFIFFFLFSFLNINFLNSKNKILNKSLGCDNEINQDYLNEIDNLKIKKIEIDTYNYRKWTVNSIKIITSGTRFIPERYKKKFDSKITITYQNDSKCIFEAKIRHSGDAKDHIALKGNSIIQSLDVRLKNGNIRGITRFKLFKPDVRGVLDDVVIQTEILRSLHYLAPRSIKVRARINKTESVMLFQEKAAKELLEFNNRREGPLLEGDQRFFFELVKNIPENNLSNWDVGTPRLRSKSIKAMLAKQTNAQIINKSAGYKDMSFNSLTNLNLIYLYYGNRFQDKKNNFNFFDYDLDNTLLGLFDSKNILKLDVYNLLLQSTNSHHALSASNRKFYWNSIENYFEPVNYDSNPDIGSALPSTTTSLFRLPVSDNYIGAFNDLESKLNNLSIPKLHKKVVLSGLVITQDAVKTKIDKILFNLKNIKVSFLNPNNKASLIHNRFKPMDNLLDKFNETIKDVDPNIFLVKQNSSTGKFQRCKIYLYNCEDYLFSNKNLFKLLEGELVIDKKIYQYLGKSLNLENTIKSKKYKKLIFDSSTIFYDDDTDIEISTNKKIINITQKKIGSKTYIINGYLNDLTINFIGLKHVEDRSIKKLINNHLINSSGLTGCLSFVNLKTDNLNINANDSSCEDAINMINVSGFINNIKIINSYSDGLDVDFSNLKINNINIESAGNDCVDFSAGNYDLGKITLVSCGDKALSVGEKSSVKLNEINASKVSVGIASKDSSIVKLNLANLENLKTCLSAYNKKQEFNGGFIEYKNMRCINYDKKFITDKYSKIIKKNKNL